jgi:nitroimidazol reductase NimA-like FMN-containing flavoprotein (pyridoxamine 5'-phosphate oxidase superfamily)
MAILLDEAPGRGFEALGDEECFALLQGHSFGRVAISVGAIPAVFSVNYHVLNKAIYFFTAPGTKLDAAIQGLVVSFQIDHFDAAYHHGWSVLAVGRSCEVEEPIIKELAAHFPLEPWAPGERSHLVKIWPDFVSGRRITFGPELARSLSDNPAVHARSMRTAAAG